MQSRSGRLALLTILVGAVTGCSGGGCSSLGPLPSKPGPTGFPFSQRIEGGMQVRITEPGFKKLSSFIPQLAQQALASGQCIGQQSQNVGIGTLTECYQGCGNGSGCPVSLNLQSVNVTVPDDPNKAVVDVDTLFSASIPFTVKLRACVFGICTNIGICDPGNPLVISAPNTHLAANIRLDIDPPTGELTLNLDSVNLENLNLNSAGCGIAGQFISDVMSVVNAIANSFLGNIIVNALKGPLNNLIQGFLPKPPGLAGTLDTGKMFASLNAPADAKMELFMVAGGYVAAYNGGLNLGVLTGMNSDRDQTTRDTNNVSEPNLCVPARPTPDLTQAPWMLPTDPTRMDPKLDPAPEFSGMPEPMDQNGNVQDLTMGLARSFLDLAGFHAYNSGTLCLAVSGSSVAMLNNGAFSVIVPSLANIVQNHKAPLAMVLRPESPFTFTLGAGGMADPLIQIHIKDFRIDFYAFVEERYVRIFTLDADMVVKLDLALQMDQNGKPIIVPTVSGIDKNSVNITAINNDLLAEDGPTIANPIKGLLDIAVSQAMGSIKPIPLPELQGFSLDGLSITRVVSNEDSFIALWGTIMKGQPGPMIAPGLPLWPDWLPKAREPSPVTTYAEVADLSVPPGDVIHAALEDKDRAPGSLPEVTLRLGATVGDPEWSWRIDGGAWHTWSDDPRPVIRDAALLLQGRHNIEVRARKKNDWSTVDPLPVGLDVMIDSVPPAIAPAQYDKARGELALHAWDNVSDEDKLQWSWKLPSGWSTPSTRAVMTLDEVVAAANGGRMIRVASIDEAGNRAELDIDVTSAVEFHGREQSSSSGGCGCQIGGHDHTTNGQVALTLLALVGLLGVALRRRFRSAKLRHDAALVGMAIACAINAGCSCNHSVATGCKIDDDCRLHMCPASQLPQCQPDGTCGCTPDTPLGDVGRYASMTLRDSTAFVAAYNNTYGDLMIGHIQPPGVITDWTFVDGVPDQSPSENTVSQVRGGITDPGDDVGEYASIALTPTGDPVVAYYDATHGALKYAQFGTLRWDAQTVDVGHGDPTMCGDDIGRWASLTVTQDGRPGIAYYAEVEKGASGKRESQLRYAQAMKSMPQGPGDWSISIVETRPMPDPTMTQPGLCEGSPTDVLPNGIALFTASARKMDDSPVVAYYDRERGNLRFAEFDGGAGMWRQPVILDGEDSAGNDTADVGWYPSVAAEGDKMHISYVDATHDNLLYVNTDTKTPEIVDDGYRPMDETTNDGLPAPVYHLVGDSSSIQVAAGGILVIAYQDSTVEQLRVAVKDETKTMWATQSIAGHATPFKGSYGFYAQARVLGGNAVLSSYAINQHLDTPSFYVETFAVTLGSIM